MKALPQLFHHKATGIPSPTGVGVPMVPTAST